jgi:exodeoxyribonuclease V alpha subunit
MRVTVESIVSEKPYGIIFNGTVVDDAVRPGGERLRVRTNLERLFGIPVAGDTWDIDGEILQTRYGRQLEARAGRRIVSSGYLLQKFLANHVPGIGSERASRLWAAFGENLPEVLSTHDMLDEIAMAMSPDKPLLGRRLAVLAVSAWKEAASEAALVAWLDLQGVKDLKVVRRLHRVFGLDAMERLAANPYVIVPLLPWRQVDKLGCRLLREDGHDPHSDRRRHVGAADEAVKRMLQRGDTAATMERFTADLAALLRAPPEGTMVSTAMAAATASGAVLPSGELLRAPGAAGLEDDLTARLKVLSQTPVHPRFVAMGAGYWSELLTDVAGSTRTLDNEQRLAAVSVMTRPFACLVGAAGTGKTHVCRVICDLWTRLGGDVLLCALAGKAALRLSRSTGRLAKTIARTLAELSERDEIEMMLAEQGASDAECGKARAKLESLSRITDRTMVVVDEASMVDLPTVHAIVKRLHPQSRLLCVGDEAQLPPIGFGLVFHKLVRDPAITVRLRGVYRQASASGIPAAAAAIRAALPPAFSAFAGPAPGISFIDSTPAMIASVVDDVVEQLGGPGDVLVVTATIGGGAGVDSINERFHRRHVADGREELRGFFGRRFAEGEPVIFGRNDYRSGLFNGLLGRVEAIDLDERTLRVQFDGDTEAKTLTDEHLVDLDLAYAVTCHKCQGSSAKRVVVPIYPTRLLERSWLYTAITRAEEQVVLIGDRQVFEACVASPPAAELRVTGAIWP